MHRTFCALASLLVLAACASAEPKRPPATLDPSNPDAPEAPHASLPGTLTAAPPSAQSPTESPEAGHARHGAAAPASTRDAGTTAPGHEHHGSASQPPARDAGTATVYTCPMHPEVRSETPGTCPICGMKLVPEQPRPGGPADAGQPRPAPSGHEHHGHGQGAHP
ncbi:heavy metal-binding domain-containing protein [Myxococcus sp. RHSTA-1-4]|uniref:heavy metal-binding domain-containing protein n=1 Tax=Myxococcus sp. RHSTA-1-4 TaxID=2874601 RepID=UPI0021023D73|nr:heavy metal-binding domain-containing protein [Myxococcus sp. RHSTA-1-4]MBZ4415313.1 hypothetical protein [Myxococcus sp. RHSTA-1-4]